jgi:glycosyltransferase involved in cell wall biosynthesis
LRLAVVSPFLDRQHGTEMCIVEQIERLASHNSWRIELYSQAVSQVQGIQVANADPKSTGSGIFWHKVSNIPGPHLLKFLWWFLINHLRRRQDLRSGRVRADLVYTPGTNCLDADAVMVQMVFHAFYDQARGELLLRRVPLQTWPRLIHRKLYYHLIMFLERKIYRNPRVCLIAVSNLIAKQLQFYLNRSDVVVIPNTVDVDRFNPQVCRSRRPDLRRTFGYSETEFVVLLIGNDWKKKGLDTLLRAAGRLQDIPLRILVVGKDDQKFYRSAVQKLGLEARFSFGAPSPDVVKFYALADLYAGPSLEDGFNLPILEAMACGLPVIASNQTGASENIADGKTGLIFDDPHDDALLARLIHKLYSDNALRQDMGTAAAEFVRMNCSWDRNAANTGEVLEQILRHRSSS